MTRRRTPGSREEDAWLSDEQLDRVAPAESEPFQGPVPTRMISNGEYMPYPQTRQQKQVEERVKELADHASRKLGITRREFLQGTGALAASFLAMNQVYGKEFFKVNREEMFDHSAREEFAPPSHLFVFDDQTHIVRSSMNSPNALRAIAQGPGAASFDAGFDSNPFNGSAGNPAGYDELGNPWTPWNPDQLHPDYPANPGPPTTVGGEFHLGQYIRRLFLESQTSVAVISNANLGLFSPAGATPGNHNISESLQAEILTGWQTSQARDYINALAGSPRALAHGQLYPGVGNLNDPMFGDYTRWQIENMQPDSWKGYNVANAAKLDNDPDSLMMRWRLDDEDVAYPMYEIIAGVDKRYLKEHPGFFNICIHKGLSANLTFPGGPNDSPNYGNPDDMVKVATDWPQFNFVIYHSCFRPAFFALQAFQDIQNEPGAMAPTTLTDSDGHTVPNIRWTTQLAQIAGGKYVAGAEPTSTSPSSPRRLKNIYAELGTTMASVIVTFPTVWAHMIGQLLHYMGDDNIVYGSDSIWYGGPQWQIEALWRSQIPEDIAERWNYPQLTKAAKRKILGLNSAELYRIWPAAAKYRQGDIPNYASDPALQPGGRMDEILRGVGYPTPVVPVDDNFTKTRKDHGHHYGHSNTRFGWMRVRR